jgi:hypothetical protein
VAYTITNTILLFVGFGTPPTALNHRIAQKFRPLCEIAAAGAV